MSQHNYCGNDNVIDGKIRFIKCLLGGYVWWVVIEPFERGNTAGEILNYQHPAPSHLPRCVLLNECLIIKLEQKYQCIDAQCSNSLTDSEFFLFIKID